MRNFYLDVFTRSYVFSLIWCSTFLCLIYIKKTIHIVALNIILLFIFYLFLIILNKEIKKIYFLYIHDSFHKSKNCKGSEIHNDIYFNVALQLKTNSLIARKYLYPLSISLFILFSFLALNFLDMSDDNKPFLNFIFNLEFILFLGIFFVLFFMLGIMRSMVYNMKDELK